MYSVLIWEIYILQYDYQYSISQCLHDIKIIISFFFTHTHTHCILFLQEINRLTPSIVNG